MNRELRTRAASATLMGTAALFITWWNPLSFDAMVGLGGLIVLGEWHRLTRTRSVWWMPLGMLYIGAGAVALGYLRHASLPITFAVLAIVWSGDIAAYMVGRRFGRHKIAPAISPGKSWEGLAGSVIMSAAVAAGLGHVAPLPHALLGAALAVIGLLGDLGESALKRHAGVKDSGMLIPGHGGLFDRVDALIPCAIFSALALYMRLHLH